MKNLVIGMGEIGIPLYDLLSTTFDTYARDIEAIEVPDSIDIIHICYPYGDDFIGTTIDYINEFNPALCVIHSTVIPGTTDEIDKEALCSIAYSPVRGRHKNMSSDLLRYVKFVGGYNTEMAIDLLGRTGLSVEEFPSARALELAKLIETTYSALLISFAQEIDRFCNELDVRYFDIMPFLKEIDYLPDVAFQPGFIGGHCLISNLELLEGVKKSQFVDVIRYSNDKRAMDGIESERLLPVPL